jgi:signal transduction histidine kinase
MSATDERVTPEQLRELFLFEKLTDEQLDWLAEHGRVHETAADEMICVEGEPATCFYVVLSGTVSMTRMVRGAQVEISRTDQRGVYGGATQAYMAHSQMPYPHSLRAVTPGKVLELPAREFGQKLREWFPMAMHLIAGLFVGMRRSEELVGQRERLLALGSLTAGLTHELNNPASAAVRATEALRERVAGMRHKLAMLAHNKIDPKVLEGLTGLQEDAVRGIASAPDLSAVEASDREDELSEWLEDHDVSGAWDMAPIFVAAGLDTVWADTVANKVPPEALDGTLRWLAYTVETELLMNEIGEAVTRMSKLVGAARQYSQLDRAELQDVDVHDGLNATLVMLGRRIEERGVKVVKEYDRSLPRIPAYAAELNQVWTNLIDNALDAMAPPGRVPDPANPPSARGTLTVRTGMDGEQVLVEICDTGPGVPKDLRSRIFEPFFTTKPVGEGTGLGLDISFRIVVTRHGGDIRVRSRPGDTRFQVRLPIHEPSPQPAT